MVEHSPKILANEEKVTTIMFAYQALWATQVSSMENLMYVYGVD